MSYNERMAQRILANAHQLKLRYVETSGQMLGDDCGDVVLSEFKRRFFDVYHGYLTTARAHLLSASKR